MTYTIKELRILDVQRALLESGGGETVRQIAKRLNMAHSYVWGILQALEKDGQIDRVEVTLGDKACVIYYTRWNEEFYANAVHSLLGRMF